MSIPTSGKTMARCIYNLVKMSVDDTIYYWRLLSFISICSCDEGRLWSTIPSYTLVLFFPIATTVLLCETKKESYQTQCFSVILVSFLVSGHNNHTHTTLQEVIQANQAVYLSVLPTHCVGCLCNVQDVCVMCMCTVFNATFIPYRKPCMSPSLYIAKHPALVVLCTPT